MLHMTNISSPSIALAVYTLPIIAYLVLTFFRIEAKLFSIGIYITIKNDGLT